MKTRIAVFLALLLCTLAWAMHAGSLATPPVDTVRVVAVGEDKMCSAVVIAPDFALTARHCLQRGLSVDGITVEYISASAPENQDAGLLYAPGLKCPCASLGARPAKGDVVVAVGFPSKLEGARRATNPAKVKLIGEFQDVAPWLSQHPMGTAIFIFTDKPILESGDSGGGLFAMQDESWKLIGINSIGVFPAPYGGEEVASGFVPVDIASKFLPRAAAL